MSVLTSLFGKKKKSFTAFCSVSREPLENGYGYLLTTAEVVSSRKYWDNIMTEPDTMSYTVNHFQKKDPMATRIRGMIFEKYSSVAKPWIVSDSFIGWFNVDKGKAKEWAKNWWQDEGEFEPSESGPADKILDEDNYMKIREYAIMEAGREKVLA